MVWCVAQRDARRVTPAMIFARFSVLKPESCVDMHRIQTMGYPCHPLVLAQLEIALKRTDTCCYTCVTGRSVSAEDLLALLLRRLDRNNSSSMNQVLPWALQHGIRTHNATNDEDVADKHVSDVRNPCLYRFICLSATMCLPEQPPTRCNRLKFVDIAGGSRPAVLM